MRMSTPGAEQGQMVARSYGWADGEYYMRTFDRSDGAVAWFVADEDSRDNLATSSYDAGGASHPPEVAEWIPCGEPEHEAGR